MSTATRAAWHADMERLRPSLEPHVIEIDGDAFLAHTCPPYLADMHAKLAQIGYANGFFEKEQA